MIQSLADCERLCAAAVGLEPHDANGEMVLRHAVRACVDNWRPSELPLHAACYGKGVTGRLDQRHVEKRLRKEKARFERDVHRATCQACGVAPILVWIGWSALSGVISWTVQRVLSWWWDRDRRDSSFRCAVMGIQKNHSRGE